MHVQKRQPGLLKTDKRDALGLANHLYNQLDRGIQVGDPLQIVRRLAPPTPAAAQVRGMVHHRQELITESTQRKNKLTAVCDELFPELTQIFRDPNGPTALVFRERFPTPAALNTASLSALQEARGKTRLLDEKKRAYVGRGRVIGRVAGQMLSVAYTLLKKDQEVLEKLPIGASLPEPTLSDPEIHHKHRAGQYQAPSAEKPRKLIEFPHN